MTDLNAVDAMMEGPSCTCHPDDRPTGPCPKLYAASECQKAALVAEVRALRGERDDLKARLALSGDTT